MRVGIFVVLLNVAVAVATFATLGLVEEVSVVEPLSKRRAATVRALRPVSM